MMSFLDFAGFSSAFGSGSRFAFSAFACSYFSLPPAILYWICWKLLTFSSPVPPLT